MTTNKTDFGFVEPTQLVEEMRDSYLDYAMSVIVSRALPDVRDGLKPVQRRILFAMNDLGMRSNSSYKKKEPFLHLHIMMKLFENACSII